MNSFFKHTTTGLILLLQCTALSGFSVNAPFTRIDSLVACSSSQVILPVIVNNFSNIGAVTLSIQYDSTVMLFELTSSSVNPVFPGAILNEAPLVAGSTLKKILIVWSSLNPVTLPDGSIIATLKFSYIGGSTALTFDNSSNGGTLCEYADSAGVQLVDTPTDVFYHNGFVSPALPVSVSISASANPFNAGTSVTFTATPTNGGSAPVYHWMVNGILVGLNSNTYTYNPLPGDQVSCALYSSLGCLSASPAVSNTIFMVLAAANPCPGIPTITISHLVSGGVAPVDKTTTYGTATNIPGEPSKCWITSNLGSDHQASSCTDATEAPAGWYWQFNRKQGYKHNGTTLTPAWTINLILETGNWQAVNDPCNLEVGNGWRIPTSSEWYNVDAGGNWYNWHGPWDSDLKLHFAGALTESGSPFYPGGIGLYWNSTQNTAYDAWLLYFDGGNGCYPSVYPKAFAMPLRCIKDPSTATLPTVVTSPASSITQNTASCGGEITSDGGAGVTDRGVCWSTTSNPTISGSHTSNGSGTGIFASNLNGLPANTLCYVRAFATNIMGTSYGNEVSFTTLSYWSCGADITINHVAGAIAPVDKTATYGTVTNIPGEPAKCWITRNLGADRQAYAVTDATELSSGWFWQFNRKQGYKHDGTTLTPAWTITSINENFDWQAENDPCTLEIDSAWRIPTYSEWYNVDEAGNWINWHGPWESDLKLHFAGSLNPGGSPFYPGGIGNYWNSTQTSDTHGWLLYFDGGNGSYPSSYPKAFAMPLRCITGNCSFYDPVSISIGASANPACEGTSVTFTATIVNGGANPTYLWKVNGINAGSNLPIYSYVPANNDIITCILTSNSTCVTGSPASSNTIVMMVNPIPNAGKINHN